MGNGTPRGTRTPNQRVKGPLLSQLSYRGVIIRIGFEPIRFPNLLVGLEPTHATRLSNRVELLLVPIFAYDKLERYTRFELVL